MAAASRLGRTSRKTGDLEVPTNSASERSSVAHLKSCAEYHLDAYTRPDSPYAFATYDRWYRSPDTLTPLDCLAANLLSLWLGQQQVIPLFRSGETPATALRRAMQLVLDRTSADEPRFIDLASIDEEPFGLVRAANRSAEGVDDWTAVTVCKVLHRLRPNLVPVYDSVVRKFYGGRERAPSEFFAALLADLKANGSWLAPLAASRRTPDGRPLSVLRAADIIVWHHVRGGGCPNG